MTVYEKIELLQSIISNGGLPQRNKLNIYSEGLKSKLTQTEYSLQRLNEIVPQIASATTVKTVSGKFITNDEQIYFYLDSFWSFLYSCLDVLAQIINIKCNLKLAENDVTFNKISKLASLDPKIAIEIKQINKGTHYKNLKKYRNCSLHRRHIAIKTSTKTDTISAGYASTSSNFSERIICDDPYLLKPKFTQKRKIETYCQKAQKYFFEKIVKLVDLVNQI
jgi:hypothetical protein